MDAQICCKLADYAKIYLKSHLMALTSKSLYILFDVIQYEIIRMSSAFLNQSVKQNKSNLQVQHVTNL